MGGDGAMLPRLASSRMSRLAGRRGLVGDGLELASARHGAVWLIIFPRQSQELNPN